MSILVLCRSFNLSKHSYYRGVKQRELEQKKVARDSITVIEVFSSHKEAYGIRRINKLMLKSDIPVLSVYRIKTIMNLIGLVSPHKNIRKRKSKIKDDANPMNNLLKTLPLDAQAHLKIIVSDTTYILSKDINYYVCFILDIYSREIIGYSASVDKNALLVKNALNSISYSLTNTNIFHSDRGVEYNNIVVNDFLCKHNIAQSFSRKGKPGDNAYSESLMKTFKTEWCSEQVSLSISNISELENIVSEFVYWYNMERLHSSLNYQSPREFLLNSSVCSG